MWAVRDAAITVTCPVTGKQPITTTWLSVDDYELDRWFYDDAGAVDDKLIIRRLNRYNEGKYTCQTSNTEGKDEAFFEVKIICESR